MSNTFGQSPLDKLRGAVALYEQFESASAPALLEGTITSIEDPGNLGRVKLLLAYLTGPKGDGYETPWVQTSGFEIYGQLPKSVVGRKVLVATVNNSYENLRAQVPQSWLTYRASEIPPARAENQNMSILIDNGSEQHVAICLKRNSQWTWERMSPLYHLHLSGDSIFQGNDSGGDFQQPIVPVATSDVIAVTSVTPYVRDSKAFPKILT